MAKDIIVSLDCGTSNIKGVALTTNGRTLAQASVFNTRISVKGGKVEQNLALTWKKVAYVLTELIQQLPNLSARILFIAITGQGDGTWLIDKKGAPVGNAFLWLDVRSAAILKQLLARDVHKALFPITGCHINACNQSTQLLWLKKHAPTLLKRATTAFHCKEWIYYKLTGERVADVSEACFTFGNYQTRTYREDILRKLGLYSYRSLLPPIIAGEKTYHPLKRSAAKLVGLPIGTPVVLGYVDVVCSALGGGIYHPREKRSCSIIGSTGIHMKAYQDFKQLEREGSMKNSPSGYTMVLPVENGVLRLQSNMAATLNFDWIARILSDSMHVAHRMNRQIEMMHVQDFLRAVDKDVSNARAAAVLYHPYIDRAGERGPFNDTSARAQLLGLHQGITYLDLLRGIYEGVGYATKHCYEAMGTLPQKIYLSGGGFSSTSFRKIFAAILNVETRRVRHLETGAIGAAMIGCLSLGIYKNLHDAARNMVDPYVISSDRESRPDSKLIKPYQAMYRIYKEVIAATQPSWQKLAALESP